MLYNKDEEKGYDQRLMGYSYLVRSTRSAAKFEKVPSTNSHISARKFFLRPRRSTMGKLKSHSDIPIFPY